MKKKINVPPFLDSEGGEERADIYSTRSSPSNKPPTAPASVSGLGSPQPSIGIDLPPIEIGPPDIGDIPIDLPGDEPPPEFHHADERENEPELGDPRDDLDPHDFQPPDDDPSEGGGGPGGGSARIGGGGGGG
jgi:hypothetical protein